MNKKILVTSFLVGGLALSGSLPTHAIGPTKDYIKEFSVSKSTSGTYSTAHAVSFGSSSSAGRGRLTKTFTFDLKTKKLTNLRLSNSVDRGEPYYTHVYAVSPTNSVARYSFDYREKFFTENPVINWKVNMVKPKEVTVYFQDNTGSTGQTQNRVYSFFKY